MKNEEITVLKDLLLEAMYKLNEVRTGEDFECECWEIAAKIQRVLGIKDDDV